jgi:hypothetical protein
MAVSSFCVGHIHSGLCRRPVYGASISHSADLAIGLHRNGMGGINDQALSSPHSQFSNACYSRFYGISGDMYAVSALMRLIVFHLVREVFGECLQSISGCRIISSENPGSLRIQKGSRGATPTANQAHDSPRQEVRLGESPRCSMRLPRPAIHHEKMSAT